MRSVKKPAHVERWCLLTGDRQIKTNDLFQAQKGNGMHDTIMFDIKYYAKIRGKY